MKKFDLHENELVGRKLVLTQRQSVTRKWPTEPQAKPLSLLMILPSLLNGILEQLTCQKQGSHLLSWQILFTFVHVIITSTNRLNKFVELLNNIYILAQNPFLAAFNEVTQFLASARN